MSRKITLDQVKKHNSAKSLWMVINDSVYDVSSFLKEHPGGSDILLEFAGKDATVDFDDVGHSTDARELLETFKIGEVSDVNDPIGCESEWQKRFLPHIIAIAVCTIIGIAIKRYYF